MLVISGRLCAGEGGFGAGEGPAIGAEHLAADGMVVHVAHTGRQSAVWVDGSKRGFAQFAECQVADIQNRQWGVGWCCVHGKNNDDKVAYFLRNGQ